MYTDMVMKISKEYIVLIVEGIVTIDVSFTIGDILCIRCYYLLVIGNTDV